VKSLFVIGGARSGKSRYAQDRIEALPGRLAFIATAEPRDAEMADRIARHQADRGARWTAYEAPVNLPEAVIAAQASADAILVDCLTLWLSNLLLGQHDIGVAASALDDALRQCRVPIALVANEVGLGIVPTNELARKFRDEAGRLNQRMAAMAEEVILVTAGLPLTLKGSRSENC
jgi:adenosylcobinamide kinase/adenosylcobinamide-phosphate guanylyltransferase